MDIQTVAGGAVTRSLKKEIESSTFDLIGQSLKLAQPCLDEGTLGLKLAGAFKKKGVTDPHLNQVINNKLRMFVEGYIENIGEKIYLKELLKRGYDSKNHDYKEVKNRGFEDLCPYEDYMNSTDIMKLHGEALYIVALQEQGFRLQGMEFKQVKRDGLGTIKPVGSKSAYENFMETKGFKGTYYETYRREILDKLTALSDDPKEMMKRILEGPAK